MKIAVTSAGMTLEDQVFSSFGRCPYYLFIDTDDMSFEVLENPNIPFQGCAGYPTVRLLAEKGIEMALTGTCGPHHIKVARSLGMGIITGVSGQVRQVVEQFKQVKAVVEHTSGVSSAASHPGANGG